MRRLAGLFELRRELKEIEDTVLQLKAEVRNLTFVNSGLHVVCSDVTAENLKLKIENESLHCEIQLLLKEDIIPAHCKSGEITHDRGKSEVHYHYQDERNDSIKTTYDPNNVRKYT